MILESMYFVFETGFMLGAAVSIAAFIFITEMAAVVNRVTSLVPKLVLRTSS